MPRSSGQNATPRRAMRSEGSAMICVPSKRIEPSRRAIMPMMAFRVVVLPTPFRPRSVTTSPRGTSNSTPWRMCDSPYHAFRPATERSAASGMLGAQVSLDHLGITGHRPIVALGDQEFPRARIQVAQTPVGLPEIERAAPLSLKRDAHVFQNLEMRKPRRNLERPDQPQPRDRGGAGTRDLAPVVEDLSAGRGKKEREQGEAGGLAPAVWGGPGG